MSSLLTVPQESTDFSPFELVYRREVRGPLGCALRDMGVNIGQREVVLSYVMLMRKQLEKMASLVQTNVVKAQDQQTCWHDKTARKRVFQPGDQVLVLLPTSTSKLTTQPDRQGCGKGELQSRYKRHQIFHVNMLQKWHVPSSTGYLAQDCRGIRG